MQDTVEGDTATTGNSFQGLEERRRAEKSESGTGCIGPKIQLELAPHVEKESKEENKDATNNVKTNVTSKGLLIKDSYQQVRIY